MVTQTNRGNPYILNRLDKLGRADLLAKIAAKEMSVYAAAIEARLRRRKSERSKSAQLSYHWSRASKSERERFMVDNFKEIDLLRKELVQRVREKLEKSE